MVTKLRQKISIKSSKYPELLRGAGKSKPLPPEVLYCEGEVDLLNSKLISIVGTRNATYFGSYETERLVSFCKKYGLVTVSGLARGIDSYVHRYSIQKGVPTIAVFPNSLDKVYPPENRQLARDIVANGGLLISEHEEPVATLKYLFPIRNRIIAGLSKVTAVIEAGAKSGALLTARYASDNDRDVFVGMGLPANKLLQGNMNLLDNYEAMPLTLTYMRLKESYDMPTKYNYKIENDSLKSIPNVTDLGRHVVTLIAQGHCETVDIISHLEKTKFRIYLKDINVILAQMQMRGILKRDAFGNLEINL
jgi:DNA processing protein